MHGAENASQRPSIEVLRFLAAMAVVFVHLPTVEVGHFGVDVFFVLSGFVMMLSTAKGHDRFFTKRLIRIVPIYYALTLGVWLLAAVAPDLLNNTVADPGELLQSLLFIPFDKNGTGHKPVLFLGWTLNYEMYFYALFALSLRWAPAQRSLLTAATLALVYVLCLGRSDYPWAAYGDPVVFEFVLGMALYEATEARRRGVAAVLVVGSLLLAALTPDLLAHRLLLYGLPSVVFVGLALRLAGGRPMPRLLVALGGASYALYLTHPYVIQFFDKVTHGFSRGPAVAALATVVSVVVVNVVALGVHRHFERPLREALRRRFVTS